MAGPSPIVRDADPVSDAAACAQIYAPYVRETVVTFEEVEPEATDFTTRIRTAQRQHAWLVAELSGRVVGYTYAGPYRPRVAYRFSCETSVYLDRAERGKGLGLTLYGALLERLTAMGYRTAVAGATLPNAASERLHETLGFQRVGVFNRVGYKFGRWCDVAWVQCDLGGDVGAGSA
ncbi:MAG TPA: GNAT family N-acetyltransferase [Ornithinimicrobium sp.]|uniref:GNAT family N-acetyltransferase n=1 Tax=Ornithinimicrobium sp. TaxID=1977084 RepID=UPI002B47F59E|nr:GNAT family N-acetyltransferase [Ornithinimicrobium sp.]HKJ11455.1 GNAT family N-acetyltransferase [Ornithinimicrobium sp.]